MANGSPPREQRTSDELIRGLIERLKDAGAIKDSAAEIEISVLNKETNSRSVLFSGKPSGPVVDKLNWRELNTLTRIVDKPWAEGRDATPDPYIAIRANRQPVLAVSATGSVRQVQQVSEKTSESSRQTSMSGYGDPMATSNSGNSSKGSQLADQLIEVFQRKQEGPEKNFLLKFIDSIRSIPQKLAENRADREVARVASELLAKYGERESGKNVYYSESYTIERQADRTTVKDEQGKNILQFVEGFPAQRIIHSSVTEDQRYDFKEAAKYIVEYGLETSSNPTQRLTQLGKLAPSGDVSVSNEMVVQNEMSKRNVHWLADTARQWNNLHGVNIEEDTRIYDGSNYFIQETPNELRVSAKDGRVVLDISGEQLRKVQVTGKDLRHFAAVQDYMLAKDVRKNVRKSPEPKSIETLESTDSIPSIDKNMEMMRAEVVSNSDAPTAADAETEPRQQVLEQRLPSETASQIEVLQPQLTVPAQFPVSEVDSSAQAVTPPVSVQPTVEPAQEQAGGVPVGQSNQTITADVGKSAQGLTGELPAQPEVLTQESGGFASELFRDKVWSTSEILQRANEAIALNSTNSAEARLVRGTIYSGFGRHDQAIEDLSVAAGSGVQSEWLDGTTVDQELNKALLRRANHHQRRGNYQDAVSDYSAALQLSPEVNTYVDRGRAQMQLGDLDAARADCDTALTLDPRSTYAYNSRASVFEKLDQPQQAQQDRDMVSSVIRGEELVEEAGSAYLEKSNSPAAVALLNQALQQDPRSYRAHAAIAKISYDAGDIAGARTAFARSAELTNSSDRWGLSIWTRGTGSVLSLPVLLEVGAEQKQQSQASMPGLETPSVVLEPGGSSPNREPSNLQPVEQQLQRAEQVIRPPELLPVEKQQEEYLNRGTEKENSGDLQGALDDYSQAVEMNQKPGLTIQSLIHRGQVHSAMGNRQEAIADFTSAIQRNPSHEFVYKLRSNEHALFGNEFAAAQDSTKAAEITQSIHFAMSAYSAFDRGDFKLSREHLDEAIRLDPQYAWHYQNRGNANSELGNTPEANRDFEKAQQLLQQQERTVAVADKRADRDSAPQVKEPTAGIEAGVIEQKLVKESSPQSQSSWLEVCCSASEIVRLKGDESIHFAYRTFINDDFTICRDYQANTLTISERESGSQPAQVLLQVDTQKGEVLLQNLSVENVQKIERLRANVEPQQSASTELSR